MEYLGCARLGKVDTRELWGTKRGLPPLCFSNQAPWAHTVASLTRDSQMLPPRKGEALTVQQAPTSEMRGSQLPQDPRQSWG